MRAQTATLSTPRVRTGGEPLPRGLRVFGAASRLGLAFAAWVLVCLSGLLACAGGGGGSGSSGAGSNQPALPSIQSFAASPAAIQGGQSSTLSWSVTGATSLTLDNGIGDVLGSTARVVSPQVTTTYSLTATNAAGSVHQTVTVNVTSGQLPFIGSFAPSRSTINAGESTLLMWSVNNATSLSLSGVGPVSQLYSGSVEVFPAATTTYTLTASNAAGSVTQTATVTVTSGQLPVIASFTASPAQISAGQSSTLAWTVSGATSLALDNGVGAVTGSSSRSVSPAATTTYRLTATNTAGSVSQTVTVSVVVSFGTPTISAFTAAPGTINAGQSATLSWSVSGATGLAIDNGVGTVTGLTSRAVSPAATTTYHLTATNAAGSSSQSVTVTVAPGQLPVIGSFTATPATISAGQSSTLAWTVTGATSLAIDNGVGAVTGLTSRSVSPSATTTYRLTATNAAGSVSQAVTVTLAAVQLPAIASFTATPAAITAGQSSTLAWSVTGATTLTIDQGVGAVTGLTSRTVAPGATTTYTLTASNSAGSVVQTVTVSVTALQPPVIGSFTATPAALTTGQSTTLAWSVTGATSLSISSVGAVAPVTAGSTVVTPGATTTYTLTASGAGGTVTRSATVTVTAPAAPVIGSFTATPATINAGQSSTLAWSVTGATSLSISSVGSVTPVTAGSTAVTPGATATYTLSATSAGGTVTRTATVTVIAAPTTTVFYPVADNSVAYSTTNAATANTAFPTANLSCGNNWAAGPVTNTWVLYGCALKFDLSSLAGKSITSATLKLWIQYLPADLGTTYTAYAYAGAWSTGSLTWNSQPGIYASPTSTVGLQATAAVPLSWDMKSFVMNWTSGYWANNGVLLRDSSFTFPGYTAYRSTVFYSMDVYDNLAHRPTLEVVWQ